MSDDDAYMMLVLDNAQSALHPLEEGLHALGAPMTQTEYGKRIGKAQRSVGDRVTSARVAKFSGYPLKDLIPHWSAIAQFHVADKWLWAALVAELPMTVEVARKLAGRLKDIPEPPEWADAAAIATALVAGDMKPKEAGRFQSRVDDTKEALKDANARARFYTNRLMEKLVEAKPSALSDVIAICDNIVERQQSLIRRWKRRELWLTRREEEASKRVARLRENVSLEEWKTLKPDQRQMLLTDVPAKVGSFNRQESTAIEWAQWSWNPVTGCLHDCPYCYARDITQNAKTASAFPNGFAPTFRPNSVFKPRIMVPPAEAATDTRFRNVFTCSMADLFGRWVPKEWIEAVLREIRDAPNWNFLCLTKFPKRMAEFDIPPNAWMGTTVDLQARVLNAETAFANVKSGVRWLSVEPMLEPLKFKNLDRFNWIVIGGSTRSTETPEFIPPVEWVIDLVNQARAAGLKIYMKTNLGISNRIVELPFDAPVGDLFADMKVAPDVFKYLGKAKVAA